MTQGVRLFVIFYYRKGRLGEIGMEKAFYGVKKSPALGSVPAQNYSMIRRKGNPNDLDFSKEHLKYTIMKRQPDFICEDIPKTALDFKTRRELCTL